MTESRYDRIQATPQSAAKWSELVDGIFKATLLPGGESANSWYLGANVPGKPRRVLFHFGGAGAYSQALDRVSAQDYTGFTFEASKGQPAVRSTAA